MASLHGCAIVEIRSRRRSSIVCTRSHPSFLSTHTLTPSSSSSLKQLAQATGAMTSKVSGAQSEASSPASSGELSTSSSTLEAALLSFANQSSTPKSREMGFSLTGRSFFFVFSFISFYCSNEAFLPKAQAVCGDEEEHTW
ncbi:hypothetical protein SETIT_4G113600v2 [Setaria italica]|uniref:Uncharacterized protein n=1 Tax=Setaria italica TaxID=4555 RepID=A0A368QT48_SETIT|nr:hypothetical protein SETIT_4G113600v2 [Setaria italica]